VPLAQQYRGHPAAARLDDEPKHVPDVAVRRVHGLTAGHLVLTGQLVRDSIDGHRPRDRPGSAWRARRARRHGALGVVIRPRGRWLPAVADVVVALILARQERLLGGIQPLELGLGAAQPDLVFDGAGSPRVNQVEGDDHGQVLVVRLLHHEVGDRVISWADDQAPELAGDAVRAVNLGS
jgi:hypothetical protein